MFLFLFFNKSLISFSSFVFILLVSRNEKPVYFCIIGWIWSLLLSENSDMGQHLLSTYYVPGFCIGLFKYSSQVWGADIIHDSYLKPKVSRVAAKVSPLSKQQSQDSCEGLREDPDSYPSYCLPRGELKDSQSHARSSSPHDYGSWFMLAVWIQPSCPERSCPLLWADTKVLKKNSQTLPLAALVRTGPYGYELLISK